ncbi:MAG: J domain-containing protein [Rhizobiaceae bacterium]|jgi:DnaJ-domain-containing protein 1|nr:J domain-containing protein [Rhizobiaceae bacterium]
MFASDAGEKRIPVTITLTDGTIVSGSLPAGPAASLAIELNRDGPFLNFKDSTGAVKFIAKASITQVQEGDVLKEGRLPTTSDGRDPYKVLRLPKNATSDMVRQSYLTLARHYHPDHFGGEHMPPEIREYATAMFQQITAAYQALKTTLSDAA